MGGGGKKNDMFRVKKGELLIYIILLFCGVAVCLTAEPIPAFIFMTLIFMLIFIRAGFSFFTAIAFIMLFSYLQLVIYKENGVSTSGFLYRVGKDLPFYLSEMTVSFVSFFLCELFFIWFTKLVGKETALYQNGHLMSASTAYLFMAAAITLVIMLFPSFPSFKLDAAARRTQGITGTYGFLLLALCLAALTIDASYRHKPLIAGYAFIIFWVFGHAERVEVLGFVIYYLIKLLNHYSSGKGKKYLFDIRKVGIILMVAAIFLLGTWVGMVRLSDEHYSLSDVIYKLVVQGTCGDVLHVFDCSIDMAKKGNLLHGYTYVDYFLQLIPGMNSKYQVSIAIADYYETNGGAFFFTEPMMNFGIVGIILSNIGFFLAMRLMLDRPTELKAYMWIPIVIEIFRITWYGRSAWILACFIEMPLVYFGVRQVLKCKRYARSKNYCNKSWANVPPAF